MASVADFSGSTRPKPGPALVSPVHFRRRSTRLVSYYALFKGMAASKPTSQLSRQIHFLTHSARTPGP